jgi:hypothetical protein
MNVRYIHQEPKQHEPHPAFVLVFTFLIMQALILWGLFWWWAVQALWEAI